MKRKKKTHLGTHLFLLFCSLITMIPCAWMILTSLKTYSESIQIPIQWFPASPQWSNYAVVWNKFPILKLYLNTFIVMILSMASQIIVCSLAAYAFARLRFKGKNFLFLLCLGMMMIPTQIFLLPHYDIITGMRLNNTLAALWIPKTFNIFAVFMLKQFFSSLPKELDEAAKIDGAGHFKIYASVLMPLMKAPIVSLCILTGLGAWKDLLWPLIINVDMDKMVLSAGLANLVGRNMTDYPQLMAGGAIAALPMIVIFVFFQKQFTEGIALSGTKA